MQVAVSIVHVKTCYLNFQYALVTSSTLFFKLYNVLNYNKNVAIQLRKIFPTPLKTTKQNNPKIGMWDIAQW